MLAIVSVLTTIVFSMGFRFYENHTHEQAIERLRFTIYEAQILAARDQRPYWIYVLDDGTVRMIKEYSTIVHTWKLPEDMKVTITTDNRIRFKANGSIGEIGLINMETAKWSKQLSLSMSKGRVRVYE